MIKQGTANILRFYFLIGKVERGRRESKLYERNKFPKHHAFQPRDVLIVLE